MNRPLLRIESLLDHFFKLWLEDRAEAKSASKKDIWHDAATTKLMLRVSERTLHNYVRDGKMHCKKIGRANFYAEDDIFILMNR